LGVIHESVGHAVGFSICDVADLKSGVLEKMSIKQGFEFLVSDQRLLYFWVSRFDLVIFIDDFSCQVWFSSCFCFHINQSDKEIYIIRCSLINYI